MKTKHLQQFVFIFLITFSISVHAQYMGIGTDSPQNNLDVSSESRTGLHPTGRPFYITGNIGGISDGAEIRHSNGTQGIGLGYRSVYAAGSNANQEINFLSKGDAPLNFNTNSVNRMIIEGNGNVGIGTATTTAKLHVVGEFRLDNASEGAGKVLVSSANGTASWSNNIPNNDVGYIWNQSATNQAADFRISGNGYINGNVGIGTIAATTKLDVDGDISLSGNLGSSILTRRSADRNWRIGNGNTTAQVGFSRSLATGFVQYATFYNSAGYGFAVGDAVSGLSSFEVTGSGNDYDAFFRGDVGIGGNPNYPLHVTKAKTNDWQGRFTNGNSNVYLAHQGGYGMHINTGETNNATRYGLTVRNASQEHFIVRDDGHVGIGKNLVNIPYQLTISDDIGMDNNSRIYGRKTNGDYQACFVPRNNANGTDLVYDAGLWIGNGSATSLSIYNDGLVDHHVKIAPGQSWGYINSCCGVAALPGSCAPFTDYGVSVACGLTHYVYLETPGAIRADMFLASSDRKWKKDIVPIPSALDKIMRLSGVTYNRFGADNVGEFDKQPSGQPIDEMRGLIGFIAQEIQEVLPQVVQEVQDSDKDGKVIGNSLAVNYDGVIPVLVEAMKEQQAQIEAQKLQIEELMKLVKEK